MKRSSKGDDEGSASPESRAEELAQRILARSRQLLLLGGIILAIVIIIALIMSFR